VGSAQVRWRGRGDTIVVVSGGDRKSLAFLKNQVL